MKLFSGRSYLIALVVLSSACNNEDDPSASSLPPPPTPSSGTSGQPAGGPWFWQNPNPQGNNLLAVTFVNATTGWTVGDAGTILSTSDAGDSWILETSGTTQHLNGVAFANAAQGWAVGDAGTILTTVD